MDGIEDSDVKDVLQSLLILLRKESTKNSQLRDALRATRTQSLEAVKQMESLCLGLQRLDAGLGSCPVSKDQCHALGAWDAIASLDETQNQLSKNVEEDLSMLISRDENIEKSLRKLAGPYNTTTRDIQERVAYQEERMNVTKPRVGQQEIRAEPRQQEQMHP